MRTVPFLVSLGLASAAVLPRVPNPGAVRREPEPEPKPEPGILFNVDLQGHSSKVRRGIDINVDLDGNSKSGRAFEPKAKAEPEPKALYRREPEPEPRGGGGGGGRGSPIKDSHGSSRSHLSHSSSGKISQASKGSQDTSKSTSSSASSQGYSNQINAGLNHIGNDFTKGDITNPQPPHKEGREKKKEGKVYRRQNLLAGFDQDAAANSFLSDNGLATWNDFSAPVDGSDACIVFKALENLAFSLVEPTEDILAQAGTKVFVPANQQSGPLVLNLRGIMIWQAILERFKTQLEATNGWSITTQLEVAECYLTYSQQAGNFLRALNDRARVFSDADPAKCLTYNKIEALYIVYDVVATLIYGRNSGIPANIQELIPNAFPNPVPDTFNTPYAAPPDRSLIADYLSIHDDPLPSGDNLFEQAQEAYTCTDFREDPRPVAGTPARNRQQTATSKAEKAAGKKAADKKADGDKSKKVVNKQGDSKEGDKKKTTSKKKDSKKKAKDDAKKDSKKERKDPNETPKKDSRKRAVAVKGKPSEDGKYYYKGDLKIGLDTDRSNVFTNDWLGSTGADSLNDEFYYDTIKVEDFKHALSLWPSITPKFDYKYYGNEKKNADLKAAMAALPKVDADVYEKEHKIGKYAVGGKDGEKKKEEERKEKEKKEREEKEKKEREEKEERERKEKEEEERKEKVKKEKEKRDEKRKEKEDREKKEQENQEKEKKD